MLKGWTNDNKQRLKCKMEKLGIMQGGIFSTYKENLKLYQELTSWIKRKN